MSVINKVLKDLDKRQASDGTPGHSGSAVAARSGNSLTVKVLIALNVVVIAVVAVVLWRWQTPTVAQTSPVQVSNHAADSKDSSVVAAQPKSAEKENAEQKNTAEPITVATTDKLADTVTLGQPVVEQATAATDNQQPVSIDQLADLALPVAAQPETKPEPEQEPKPESKTEPEEPVGSFSKRSVTLTPEQIAEQAIDRARDAQQKGLFTDAAEYFQDALEAQPDWHNARKEWAALEYGQGHLSKALRITRDGLNQFPDAHSLRLLAANILQREGESQVALNLLLQRQPDGKGFTNYYQLQAELAQQLHNSEAMQQAYRALIQAEPQQGRWYLGLALALRDSQPKQALAAFEQAATKITHQQTLTFIAQQIQRLRSQHEATTP